LETTVLSCSSNMCIFITDSSSYRISWSLHESGVSLPAEGSCTTLHRDVVFYYCDSIFRNCSPHIICIIVMDCSCLTELRELHSLGLHQQFTVQILYGHFLIKLELLFALEW
jgi:hypothetical protein